MGQGQSSSGHSGSESFGSGDYYDTDKSRSYASTVNPGSAPATSSSVTYEICKSSSYGFVEKCVSSQTRTDGPPSAGVRVCVGGATKACLTYDTSGGFGIAKSVSTPIGAGQSLPPASSNLTTSITLTSCVADGPSTRCQTISTGSDNPGGYTIGTSDTVSAGLFEITNSSSIEKREK